MLKKLQGMVVVHWDKWNKKWRVTAQDTVILVDKVELRDCYFFVQPEGRNIVRERKVEEIEANGRTEKEAEKEARFPHAFLIGFLVDELPKNLSLPSSASVWKEAGYNPFTDHSFLYVREGEKKPLYNSQYARMDLKGMQVVI